MKVKIHRGTKEIGGNCIQVTAENGKILWIDIGAPLSNENPDVSYAGNKVDALLISHPHQDHYGLMEEIDRDVPVYIGQVSLDLIAATRIFLGRPLPTGNFKIFEPFEWFTVADTFRIYPYLMDHSSAEAFAFVVEADGKRLFYSGDFRSIGWRGKLYYKLLNDPPKDIDLFLTEGTMVERSNQAYPTEKSVQEAINEIVRDQENITFVVSSGQNIDRLVSVVKACNSNRKKLVVDVYTAWVLDIVHKKSEHLPIIDWDVVWVYNHPNQRKKIAGDEFASFSERLDRNDVGNRVFDNPQDFVYFLRCPNAKLVKVLAPRGVIHLIYSQWDGYLKGGHKTYCADIIQDLRDSNLIEFRHIHTSGHATLVDLKRLAKAMNPKRIVPIHTENPRKVKKEFEKAGILNMEIWDDDKEYTL